MAICLLGAADRIVRHWKSMFLPCRIFRSFHRNFSVRLHTYGMLIFSGDTVFSTERQSLTGLKINQFFQLTNSLSTKERQKFQGTLKATCKTGFIFHKKENFPKISGNIFQIHSHRVFQTLGSIWESIVFSFKKSVRLWITVSRTNKKLDADIFKIRIIFPKKLTAGRQSFRD